MKTHMLFISIGCCLLLRGITLAENSNDKAAHALPEKPKAASARGAHPVEKELVHNEIHSPGKNLENIEPFRRPSKGESPTHQQQSGKELHLPQSEGSSGVDNQLVIKKRITEEHGSFARLPAEIAIGQPAFNSVRTRGPILEALGGPAQRLTKSSAVLSGAQFRQQKFR